MKPSSLKPNLCLDGWLLATACAGALILLPAPGGTQAGGTTSGTGGAAAAPPRPTSAAPVPPAAAVTLVALTSPAAPVAPATPVAPAQSAAAVPLAAPATPVAPAPLAAPGAPAGPAGGPPAAAGLYLGPTACGSSSCHGSVAPRKTLGVRQDEYFIWQKQDLHAQAYGVLFNDRSRAIARRLRLGEPGESRACLGCHALSVPARLRRGPLELEDGVSCESCHGAAGGWLEGHRSESWTHRQSVEAGMTDLRAVGVRAAVCLSCHLGGADQTVDHELIAAGHPRLAFELDNYSEAMPAHWLPFADRQAAGGPAAAGAGERDTHGTRAWAVGQAASFRAGLDRLAGRARAAASGSATAGGRQLWPEFSALSCDSCHHSLAQERWRTAPAGGGHGGGAGGGILHPGGAGHPGLPRFSPAQYAVLRQLVALVAPARQAALDAGVERLAGQLARLGTPPGEVAATAEQLGREAAELIPLLDRASWDDAQARRLLLAIARDEGGLEVADYPSAQQAALAVQTLVSQLQAAEPRRLRAGLASAAEGLAAELQDSYAFDAGRFAERLAQLGRQLQ